MLSEVTSVNTMANSHYDIDILLATYNSGRFIGPLLESICKQSVADYRIIIRDDCSRRDSGEEIIKEYKTKCNIVFVKGDRNVGAMKNFSLLIDMTQADYVMFADGDDVWLPDKIQRTFDKMVLYEKEYGKDVPILIHTDLKVVDAGLHIVHDSFWSYQNIKPATCSSFKNLLIRNSITGCTVMINKALRDLACPVPSEAIMHDWWIALIAAAFGKIGHVDEQTIMYRQHENNDTGARKWALNTILKAAFDPKCVRERLLLKQRQAFAFLQRFNKRISFEQRAILEALSGYQSMGFFERRYNFMKNGLAEDNVIRNIGMYLYM